MSTRRSFRRVSVSVLVALFLASCARGIAPARPLIAPGTGRAETPAVAIEANGTRHYVWTDCRESGSTSTCDLVYQRMRLGATLLQRVFTVVEGAQNRNPDVAVTSDGRAFVLRNVCTPDPGSVCSVYYSIIPPDATDETVITSTIIGSTSAGPPKVEARDNTVYVIYESPNGAGTQLQYRQISGGALHGTVDNHADRDIHSPRFVIDSSGNFHVVYKSNVTTSGSTYVDLRYANSIGTSGDIATRHVITWSTNRNTSPLSDPDLAVADDNTVYIVASSRGASTDLLSLWTRSASGGAPTHQTVPLSGAPEWRINGNPRITTVSSLGEIPQIAFSASNSTTSGFNQIFLYSPPVVGPDPGPTQLTTDATQKGEPVIDRVVGKSGDFEGYGSVVGWRTFTTVLFFRCYGNAFFYQGGEIRQVFEGTGTCFNYAQDMAARGSHVTGVWLDRRSSESARLVPWTTYNEYQARAPMVVK